ncbi:MAG: hypothetical protein ACSW8F_04665, partial [bacterium]
VTLGVVAALILAFFGFGGQGLGLGGGNGIGFGTGTGDAAQPTPTEAAEPAAQEPLPAEETQEGDAGEAQLTLTVRESAFYLDGEEVSAEALEEAFTARYTEGVKVVLKDENAIKAAYDEAVSLLTRLDIPYEAA